MLVCCLLIGILGCDNAKHRTSYDISEPGVSVSTKAYKEDELNTLYGPKHNRIFEAAIMDVAKTRELALNTEFDSVRISRDGQSTYSEFPLNVALSLVAALDTFQEIAPSGSDVVGPIPEGSILQLQYIVNEPEGPTMPLSIEVIDQDSIILGFTRCETSDASTIDLINKITAIGESLVPDKHDIDQPTK